MTPLDENHQALLIRLYRRAGDDDAAAAQLAACTALFEAELGSAPGVAVRAAIHENRQARRELGRRPDDRRTGRGWCRSGVCRARSTPGVTSLRTAARLADAAGVDAAADPGPAGSRARR